MVALTGGSARDLVKFGVEPSLKWGNCGGSRSEEVAVHCTYSM